MLYHIAMGLARRLSRTWQMRAVRLEELGAAMRKAENNVP